MLKIHIHNSRSVIEGEISNDWNENKEFHAAIRLAMSYDVPGADYSPLYKEDKWDGKMSVYRKMEKSFPTGCTRRLTDLLKEKGIPYKLIDERKKPNQNINLSTCLEEKGKSLYWYQEKAVEQSLKIGRGILAIGTGGGKTITSCELLARIRSAPFLFYVPSISLLRQTHSEFTKYLRVDGKPPHIGFVGAGVYDINPNGINVITYQTALAAFGQIYKETTHKLEANPLAGEKVKKTLEQLQYEFENSKQVYNQAFEAATLKYTDIKSDPKARPKDFDRAVNKEVSDAKKLMTKSEKSLSTRLQSIKNKANIRRLITSSKGFIVDEAHIAAVIIEFLGEQAASAYWRFGVSGTPFREDNQEIRIEGTMGKKLIELSSSDLIELGVLVPAHIYQIKLNYLAPEDKNDTYQDAYRKNIVHNWERNFRIKQFAEAFKEINKPVLILVEHIEHGQILEQMIKDSIFIAGSDKGEDDASSAERDYRRRILNETEANNVILIATQWAYVGIDAPAITTLILAGSCQSAVSLYQMIGRVLRKSDATGKDKAYVIDFNDREDNLHQHSVYRKKVFKRESNWVFNQINIKSVV